MSIKNINTGQAPILWSTFKQAVDDVNENFSDLATQINNIEIGAVSWKTLIGKPEFADVAISGDYDDLINTPNLTALLAMKQDLLVSGSNIKTVNGESILGSGNISISLAELSWGSITGSLGDQTDLQTALDLKANNASISAVGLSNNYEDLDNKPEIPTDVSDLTDNEELLGGSALQSRTVLEGTVTVDNDSTEFLDLQGFKGYVLYKISTNQASWIRIYSDSASRTNDLGRSESVDPLSGSGVIAEIITSGSETVLVTPGTIGFNDESPVNSTIAVSVTNKTGSNGVPITVSLTVLQIED